MNNNKLTNLYLHLLQEADKTTSRKEAIYLIREADRLRLRMAETPSQ